MTSVGKLFLKMGLIRDNFQIDGKDEPFTLLLNISMRLLVAESPIRDKSVHDTLSGPVAFLGLAAFLIVSFIRS